MKQKTGDALMIQSTALAFAYLLAPKTDATAESYMFSLAQET